MNRRMHTIIGISAERGTRAEDKAGEAAMEDRNKTWHF